MVMHFSSGGECLPRLGMSALIGATRWAADPTRVICVRKRRTRHE